MENVETGTPHPVVDLRIESYYYENIVQFFNKLIAYEYDKGISSSMLTRPQLALLTRQNEPQKFYIYDPIIDTRPAITSVPTQQSMLLRAAPLRRQENYECQLSSF